MVRAERRGTRKIAQVSHWYHRIKVAPGVVTPGVSDSGKMLEAMELPERLDGMRVLDVGARDGYFSFAAERRGAEVLAIDSVAPHVTGFAAASSLVGSSVEYRTLNVYDLDSKNVGTFDVIFFLGVLYHLRDPMLALDRLREVARPEATIWVESRIMDQGLVDPKTRELKNLSSVAPKLVEVPMAQFYPGDLLADNFTNWWGPNLAGLGAMVEAAGFEVLRSRLSGSRGLIVGRKEEDRETIFLRDLDRKVIEDREIISSRDFDRGDGGHAGTSGIRWRRNGEFIECPWPSRSQSSATRGIGSSRGTPESKMHAVEQYVLAGGTQG